MPPYNQLIMITAFESSDRASIGWVEFTSKPDASISVIAYVFQKERCWADVDNRANGDLETMHSSPLQTIFILSELRIDSD